MRFANVFIIVSLEKYMDYKYIEQLLERYFNAETTLEEESILHSFFRQAEIPARLEQWRALFTISDEDTLGEDFDARVLAMIEDKAAHDNSSEGAGMQANTVKAKEIRLTQRLMPLFKAAAVIAIFLTIGGALQAPWDSSWNKPVDYASYQQNLDSVAAVSPVQAENISEGALDSTAIRLPEQPTN